MAESASPVAAAMKRYAFCETVIACSISPWHIRELTDQGWKFGGGADTNSLCGRVVSWDLKSPVNVYLTHCCKACREIYLARMHVNK